MMMREGLTFDDVILEPKYTDMSRSQVTLKSKLGPYKFDNPFVSSNMDTITGPKMAHAMNQSGGFGILHRFCSVEDNCKMFEQYINLFDNDVTPEEVANFGISIGIKDEEIERAAALYEAGARIICVDIAHGHCKQMGRMISKLRVNFPEATIIAGNIATYAGADYLISKGAHAVKVGIGPGGACSTRIKTGCGVPQLTAIMEASKANGIIIADGGVKTPGDAVKALAAGAHFVMLGSFFAGCDETPGEIVEYPSTHSDLFYGKPINNIIRRKQFRGMASREAQEDFMGKMDDWKTAEGVSIEVPCAGPVANKIADLCGGLRSGMTYCGASTIDELHRRADFVRITHSGYLEGTPHASTRLG
jgi:IMP dehydrogenase